MKRLMLVGIVALVAACDSGDEGATGLGPTTPGIDATASLVSGAPAFVTVTGALSTTYLMPQRNGCLDVSIRGSEASFARDHVKYVEGKTIDFRSSSEAVRYSATTPTSADLIDTGRKLGRFEVCLALGEYSVQVPRSNSYVIFVQGEPGASLVTFAELEARDFVCNLHLSTLGRLLAEDPCKGGGWVDSYA